MSDRVLEARSLSVEYRGHGPPVHALAAVTLTVEPGESVGIVGESGCGKSTLARALIRLLPSTARVSAGEVHWAGQSMLDLDDAALRSLRAKTLAFVPQASMNAINPALTLRAQFRELLGVRAGMSRLQSDARAAELCRMVGVDSDRLHAYAHQLSGGMRQRMVVAMALALDPEVLIADEATTGLDTIVQARILTKLAELQRDRGFALIYITHDFGLVLDACARIVVMYAGKIVETGPTDLVYDQPRHPYTMGLRNSIPEVAHRRTLTSIAGAPPDLSDPPVGCRFANRCPFSLDRCHQEEPPLEDVGGWLVACHRASEAAELRERAANPTTWAVVE